MLIALAASAFAWASYRMKDLTDAHMLRTHVIGCLETADVTTEPDVKQQLLTFVVVGAGIFRA